MRRLSLVIAASLVARHAARADHRLLSLRRRSESSLGPWWVMPAGSGQG
jgi:hypothetical protein